MEGSDYINASFIDVSSYIFSSKNHVLLRHAVFLTQGYPDKKKAYIASQGATFDLPVQYSSFFTTCFSSYLFYYCLRVPMIRSYRADSGKVLGDDMGVPGPHYRHAYSLCRERQGQFVSYNFFVSSTTTFGTSILATIMYKTVVEC